MTEPKEESGLGFFLQSERERKGLTREHMAKATRLRIQYIEALEKEDWGQLPSLAFAKGFVKAYSKALGLDYREVMGRFESSIPVYDDLPKPLVPLKKTNKKYVFLVFFIIFILILCAVFFMRIPVSLLKKVEIVFTENLENETVQTQTYDQGKKQMRLSDQDSVSNNGQLPDNNLGNETGPEKMPTEDGIEFPGLSRTSPVQGDSLNQIEEQINKVHAKHTLTGYVTLRTYIKIYVDHNPPREYIFSPGSYPQWRGEEGFYVLVGNAAGIEFDFNGERIKDLGDYGDVVRLRLPENFNLNVDEN